MGKTNNTFIDFLDLLRVKHTQSFSNACYNEQSHKNKLFGSFLYKVFLLPFFLLINTLSCLFFYILINRFTFVRLFYPFEPDLSETAVHNPKDRPCSIREVKQSPPAVFRKSTQEWGKGCKVHATTKVESGKRVISVFDKSK